MLYTDTFTLFLSMCKGTDKSGTNISNHSCPLRMGIVLNWMCLGKRLWLKKKWWQEFQYLYVSHLDLKMFRQACKMTMTCFQQSFFCYRRTFIFREQKLSLSTARNVQLVKRTFQLQKFFSQPKSALWCIFWFIDRLYQWDIK